MLTPAHADRIDLGRGERDGGDDGLTHEERIDRLASRFDSRLDHLLERDGLSDEQKSALLAAKEDFDKMVDRLKNAGDSIRPGVASKAFRSMVHDLSSNVRSILAEDHQGQDGVGGRRGIVPEAPPVDDGDGDNDGLPHIEPSEVQRIGGGGEREQGDPLDRLHELQDRFDARFEAYLSKDGLDPAQADALRAAKDQFDKVLQRLENAYTKGDKDASFLRFGFNVALDGLREDLEGVFPEPHDQYGKPADGMHGRGVELYQQRGEKSVLAAPVPPRVDEVV